MNSLSWMVDILPGSQVTEVRAFFISKDGEKYSRNQYYRADQYQELELAVSRLESHPEIYGGIYWIMNPLPPEFIFRNQGRRTPFLTRVVSAHATDVVRREWMLIDCDPEREPHSSATDSERFRAHQLAADVALNLQTFGFRGIVEGDSGNGCHLLVPIDLPNDEAGSILVKSFLEGLSTHVTLPGVKTDTITYDAPRLTRLYGTRSRKGESSAERPHRTTQIRPRPPLAEIIASRSSNVESMRRMMEAWAATKAPGTTRSPLESARAYLSKVPGAVSGEGGHSRTYRAAMLCVEGFGLDATEATTLLHEWNQSCLPPWSDVEIDHKVREAVKKADPSRLGHLLAKSITSVAKQSPEPISAPQNRSDASAADLIRLGKTLQWIWPGWMQRGALVSIAAEPGVGKTRFVADLIRRVVNGEVWPDGSPATLPPGGKILWMPCDGQWGEIAEIPTAFGIPPENIILNAWNDDPTQGTILDTAAQFAELSSRIERNGIDMVFVDSAMNATSHGTMKPEDAIKFFVPLMRIASERNCVIVLITHLSKEGQALGRRIVGQVRQLIRIVGPATNPDLAPDERLIFVEKSNSKLPPQLISTMHDSGAHYRPLVAATAAPAGNPSLAGLLTFMTAGFFRREVDVIASLARHGCTEQAAKDLINGSNVKRYTLHGEAFLAGPPNG